MNDAPFPLPIVLGVVVSFAVALALLFWVIRVNRR
jgi:high-affinity Fe2+/Pb2+ permease